MTRLQPFDLLADDLVQLVFFRCDQECRTCILPLVCRRFAQLLRGPSGCWRKLRFVQRPVYDDAAVQAQQRAQLLQFLTWAVPRAASVLELDLESYVDADGPLLAALLSGLLNQCSALQVADLYLAEPMVPCVLPPVVAYPCLRNLHLMSDGAMPAALNLGCLPRLLKLGLHFLGPVTSGTFNLPESLPLSLESLVLNPVPVQPDGTGLIPGCVMQLPLLRQLDISRCDNMPSLEASLLQLTRLTSLALCDSQLEEVPRCLAELHNLRQLHVHEAVRADVQAVDFTFLSRLTGLQLLNLGFRSGMQQAPPQLAVLTNLVVLHMDESSLEALPESLSALVRLQILGMDWRPLLSSHSVLPTLPRMWRLMLCKTNLSEAQEGMRPREIDALLSSLQRCRALKSVQISIADDARLSVPVASVLAYLPRRCPAAKLEVTSVSDLEIGGMPEDELEALLLASGG